MVTTQNNNITQIDFARQQRARVEAHLNDVTPEQVGACERVYDCQKKEWFYKVLNSRGLVNDYGELIKYEVRWNRATGFSCTCPSGANGWWNVKHSSKVCQHVRSALMARREEAAAHAVIAVAQANEVINAAVAPKKQSIEEKWGIPAWIMCARPAPHMKHSPRELSK